MTKPESSVNVLDQVFPLDQSDIVFGDLYLASPRVAYTYLNITRSPHHEDLGFEAYTLVLDGLIGMVESRLAAIDSQ